MYIQLRIEFGMTGITNFELTGNIIKMKELIRRSKSCVCRDSMDLDMTMPLFKPLMGMFQVGYLNNLRYITLPRQDVNPTNTWINGFIECARDSTCKSYNGYEFCDEIEEPDMPRRPIML